MRLRLVHSLICGILTVFATGVVGQTPLSASDQKIILDFEKRVKEFADLREDLKGRLPKLSDDATANQISAHKTAFQKSVQAARAAAKPGDLFTADAAAVIRRLIKAEFKGWRRTQLRKTVLEADNKGILLKINIPYPESKELVEMSPALLLALPQLTRNLRYRFAGRSLLILDRDNALIIDYMKNALP